MRLICRRKASLAWSESGISRPKSGFEGAFGNEVQVLSGSGSVSHGLWMVSEGREKDIISLRVCILLIQTTWKASAKASYMREIVYPARLGRQPWHRPAAV